MKKVLIAIISVAIREKTPVSIGIKSNGGIVMLVGSNNSKFLQFESEPETNSPNLLLNIFDTFQPEKTATLTLDCDGKPILVSQTESNTYSLQVGEVSILFLRTFQSDPFSPVPVQAALVTQQGFTSNQN